jgi:hypothetical protein
LATTAGHPESRTWTRLRTACPRWSFHLQIYFLSERKAQVEIGRSSLSFIQDRTIYEDAEIFARTLHEQGSMTEVDYRNYVSLFECMVSFLRRPDLILYLKASPETLMGRIARRGRSSESAIGIDYIARLNRAYDDWMRRARGEIEVLEIDTDRCRCRGRPGVPRTGRPRAATRAGAAGAAFAPVKDARAEAGSADGPGSAAPVAARRAAGVASRLDHGGAAPA